MIKTGPDYSRLKSSLVNSQTQITNNALYQTIDQLITGVKTFQSVIIDTIDKEFARVNDLIGLYDQGHFDCDAADTGGTEIPFNRTFNSVEAIIGLPISTSPLTVTIDFDFTFANPISFNAFVWDNSGARVSATISWLARGIIKK